MSSDRREEKPHPHRTVKWSPPYRRENVEQPEFDLIARSRGSDQILEESFRLGGSKQRRVFREFLRVVTENAHAIDAAAAKEDLRGILDASRTMGVDG